MAITVPNPTSPTESVAGYHAAVVHEFNAPLTVEQVPWRELQPGQILVQVEACGLCHTDIHAAHGDWPIKPSPPFIPGHEGVGIVQELGPGVTEVACGDRVAMPWLGYACGTCDYCVSGRETLCESQQNMGYSIDGAFGEYAVAYARYVAKVPDGGERPAGVMIARGDLAVECGYERLAEVQEEILWLCQAAHVPVIWAPQVLDQLAKTGRPSRAEITDAAMGVQAECVMLNKGPRIIEAISVLDDILRRMERHHRKKRSLLPRLQASDYVHTDRGTETLTIS